MIIFRNKKRGKKIAFARFLSYIGYNPSGIVVALVLVWYFFIKLGYLIE